MKEPIKFLRPNQLAKKQGLSIGVLRKWLFQRKENGLDKAVIRIGRNLFIDEEEYLKWFYSNLETELVFRKL